MLNNFAVFAVLVVASPQAPVAGNRPAGEDASIATYYLRRPLATDLAAFLHEHFADRLEVRVVDAPPSRPGALAKLDLRVKAGDCGFVNGFVGLFMPSISTDDPTDGEFAASYIALDGGRIRPPQPPAGRLVVYRLAGRKARALQALLAKHAPGAARVEVTPGTLRVTAIQRHQDALRPMLEEMGAEITKSK